MTIKKFEKLQKRGRPKTAAAETELQIVDESFDNGEVNRSLDLETNETCVTTREDSDFPQDLTRATWSFFERIGNP